MCVGSHCVTHSRMVGNVAGWYHLGVPNPAIHPVVCAICGVEFKVGRQRLETSKAFTCSKVCLSQLRSRNMLAHRGSGEARYATCPICSERFIRKPSQQAKYKNSYCGRECRAVGIRGPKPTLITGRFVPCETCHRKVWRTPATLRPHTYCSFRCMGLDPASRAKVKPNMRGPKHFRWNGGSSMTRTPYAPGFTERVKVRIRQRDGYRCRNCGTRPQRLKLLVVHHLDGRKVDHSPSNLVTLCSPCHSRHHHGGMPLTLRVI